MSVDRIYLGAGCFWGVESYFSSIPGVIKTCVGYANGRVQTTSYENLKQTDHVECVCLEYDKRVISLFEILFHLFRIIDPVSVNKQGNDIGRQYRTGIYYLNDFQKSLIDKFLLHKSLTIRNIAVECQKLDHFVVAEEYHQKYLDKNPNGYCHIPKKISALPLFDINSFRLVESYCSDDTQMKGIYVDKKNGVPLFSTLSLLENKPEEVLFLDPIISSWIHEEADQVFSSSSGLKIGMKRNEVFCINRNMVVFIPLEGDSVKIDMDCVYWDFKVFV